MMGLLRVVPSLLLLSLPGPSSGSDDDGTVVLTTSGPVRGKRLPAGSGTVTAFLGIPYAKPPVGALRFQKPLPHQPWSHVLEATSFGNACHQPPLTDYPDADIFFVNTPQSEDCLFLNVWMPHPRPPVPAPILVWIHGGGFYMGATSVELHSGRFLAATENVIVASMNYRLGALGFLSLPPAAPGNAGLWDQRLALRWLRNNAATFGGDPARLMLFGQSAGAAAVGLHLLSPRSRSLFTRAAIQSGAPTAPWAWISPTTAKKRARRLGQLLGCTDSDDTALVGCRESGGVRCSEFVRPLRSGCYGPVKPLPAGTSSVSAWQDGSKARGGWGLRAMCVPQEQTRICGAQEVAHEELSNYNSPAGGTRPSLQMTASSSC